MASTVNPQVTDAITQTNVEVLGLSPAVATANLYQMVSQAIGNASNNATSTQQGLDLVLTSVVSVGCAVVMAQKPS